MKILKSPRWRRRLTKIAVVLAIFPLAYLGIHYSTGGNPENANGPQVANYVQPKKSPFTKAEQRAVHPVLAQFIKYAVARQDPAKAWDVAGPDLRSGLTRREWNTGAIPVVNYPAADRGLGSWSYVKYSYTNLVGLEVFVFPKPGSGYSAMTADAEVRKDSDGRWQVNYWMPERFHGPASVSAKSTPTKTKKVALGASKKSASQKSASSSDANPNQALIGGLWWALPIALLSLIVLAPLTLLVIGLIKNRRDARESLGT